ncbi:MAG: DUF1501 domain-containing protein [Planctomycetes bacterium]|nr:DUF1501 domain-containing protein [Planctomycetota bacterium]
MISLPGSGVLLCEGLTRREWLRAGGLGALGLSLPDLLRQRAEAAPRLARQGHFGRARSCILAFLFGAPAHQDVWDLKPDAPREVRGEFKPIATTVPGILVGEHVPRVARQAHRFAIVRSVSHPDNTHTVAMHYMLTGHRHLQPATNPQNKPTDFPTFGAVMRYLRPGPGPLPSGVSLNSPANQVSAANHIFPGFFAGFLGSAHDPLFVAQDPSLDDFRPFPSVEGAVAQRLLDRRVLLSVVDAQRRVLAQSAAVRALDAHEARAFDLVTSPAARRAFDLSRESDRARDRYGRTPFGQGLLLARRLVEAGVGLVTVNWARDDAFWDTHADNFRLLKNSLLPPFDVAFAALLEDLAQRGLLDETLVVCLGEFGRTPKINGAAGRDHWAPCNSVVLAGGGVCGGQVYGASDRQAAFPTTAPVSPGDLSATIYQALGIDTHTQVRDHLGRPLPLSDGAPVTALFR